MSENTYAEEQAMNRYTVSVTVECQCTIEVFAENEHDALDEARSKYVREDCDVDPPHSADWGGAEVAPRAKS